ncbi:hypothetical protein RR48_13858 [Papilio machaon]|uniref:Uncharacterized protein n=1 Tax=Papilio machaon TaxID=76193 RepID=A0A194RHF0_PAPMA|nr:hypothetical protein RR48_13858 [Papilio machaon]
MGECCRVPEFPADMRKPRKWCGSRREWSSPPDVARRVYSSVFLGSPGEYPGKYTTQIYTFYNYL